AVAELFPVHLSRSGAEKNVVVDISHVTDVGHVSSEKTQIADENVESRVGEGMAEVSGVVGSDAAYVDSDGLIGERFVFAGERVAENGIRHVRSPSGRRQRGCGHPAGHPVFRLFQSQARSGSDRGRVSRSLGTSGPAATKRAGVQWPPAGCLHEGR